MSMFVSYTRRATLNEDQAEMNIKDGHDDVCVVVGVGAQGISYHVIVFSCEHAGPGELHLRIQANRRTRMGSIVTVDGVGASFYSFESLTS